MARLAFAADNLATALELLGQQLVRAHDLVEGVGDLARDADPVARQAHREVAVAHGLERAQELALVRVRISIAPAAGTRRRRHILWITHSIPPSGAAACEL